jgi:hypothetical protein
LVRVQSRHLLTSCHSHGPHPATTPNEQSPDGRGTFLTVPIEPSVARTSVSPSASPTRVHGPPRRLRRAAGLGASEFGDGIIIGFIDTSR